MHSSTQTSRDLALLFPAEAESVISLDVVKRIVRSSPKDEDDKCTLQFFLRYLEEVSTRKEGTVYIEFDTKKLYCTLIG